MRPFAISIGIVVALWSILIAVGAIAGVLLPVKPGGTTGKTASKTASAHDYKEPKTTVAKPKQKVPPKYKVESAGKYQEPKAPAFKVESAAKYGGGDPEESKQQE